MYQAVLHRRSITMSPPLFDLDKFLRESEIAFTDYFAEVARAVAYNQNRIIRKPTKVLIRISHSE